LQNVVLSYECMDFLDIEEVIHTDLTHPTRTDHPGTRSVLLRLR
jgi:hypothetical protein